MTPNDKRRLVRPVEPSHGPNPKRPEGAVPSEAETVERWLQRGRAAIPQYERDATRADWMFRKMEAFARLHGGRLAVIRLAEVLSHLESLTRRGHKEWQVLQLLDAICILLSFGCDRQNVRMSEVREHGLRDRANLVGDGYGTPSVSARIRAEVGTASEMRAAEGFPIPVAFTAGTILDRLSRRMRLLHYSRRTEEVWQGAVDAFTLPRDRSLKGHSGVSTLRPDRFRRTGFWRRKRVLAAMLLPLAPLFRRESSCRRLSRFAQPTIRAM